MGEALERFKAQQRAAPGEIVGRLEDGTAIRQAKEVTSGPRIHPVTADDLMQREFPLLHEPVRGLIVEGLTLLCGSSKIGKSWLVLAMACAVAAGKPFLGRSTEQGTVLYLALEDSQRRIQYRLGQLRENPGAALHFLTHAPTLDGGLLAALEDWAGENPSATMIIIDTLQKIRGGALPSRASAYAADYDLMGRLKQFADAHHIAVGLVHHLNKLKDVSDPYDRISGSTGLMGAADTTVLISRERGSDDATVSYTGSDVWGDDFHLRMQEGRWQAISAEARAREAFEKDDLVRLIRDLADEAVGGMFKISLQGLMDAAVNRYGVMIAATTNELSRRLEALAPGLEEYDGIGLQTGKRVGSERGVCIVKGGRG